MSGSPKYTTVTIAPAYARLEADRRRSREAARKRLDAQRAKERAERAARRAREAAARRERARAEAERREAELAARRAARQEAHAARSRQEQSGADARRLAEVEGLLGRVRGQDSEVRVLRERLDLLRDGVGRAQELGPAIEELRGRVVLLGREGEAPDPGAGHGAVLAGLEERLARIGPEAREHDPQGYRRCVDLLGELRAATGPGGRTRFGALLGTVEHALTRHAATGGERAAEELLRAGRAREAARRAEESAAGREAERQARAEARARAAEEAAEAERERLAAALAEAADRLAVVRQSVEEAAAEAVELADPELAERIEAALTAVTGPLAAGSAGDALTAVAALEELLVGAEARLDELQLAHMRRMDLAEALRDAMLGEGFSFTGGTERDGRLLLSFERPSGATYRTTIGTDGDDAVLLYQVDGEPDVLLRPDPQGAACDRTEDLLERVHEAIEEREDFVPGELTWQGKRSGEQPPPSAAAEWTWSR
ncbi:hypothetical protein ABZW32_17035 [Streptomyces sp. NPDC004667]|uniref:hypothetical protein n=1 Tax=Streptomyces sp. NPDC004667 TaxID=3154285 RepID=UPI0033AEB9D2